MTGQQSVGQQNGLAVSTNLTINGHPHTLAIEPWTSLLDLLREGFQLTGSKRVATMGNVVPAPCW